MSWYMFITSIQFDEKNFQYFVFMLLANKWNKIHKQQFEK